MELLFSDRFDRGELVNARVVDQDIQTAVILDGCIDDALRLGGFRDVAPHGNCPATGCSDGGHHGICSGFAGGIVDHNRSAFCGECLSDGGSDTFGCACDDCDLTFEFTHVHFSFKSCMVKKLNRIETKGFLHLLESALTLR